MNNISLTASMRSNLLSLQNISRQVSSTQNKLATGNKVNSAIDNPSSYYTARALNNRADDLNALLDSMGQAVSTIKAANEGIEAAAGLLEQMQAVTEQTLTEAEMVPVSDCAQFEDNSAELIAQGYTAITADMTAADIKAILDTDNAKVVLTEDVQLSGGLNVSGKNITINGGGHTLSFDGLSSSGSGLTVENIKINSILDASTAWGRSIYCDTGDVTIRNVEITQNNANYQTSGIELRGSNNVVENVNIGINGVDEATQLLGIHIWGSGTVSNVSVDIKAVNEDTLTAAIGSRTDQVVVKNIGLFASGGRSYGVIGQISGVESRPVGGMAQRPSALYSGQANTHMIINQLEDKAPAAWAVDQFYVGNKYGAFGQGTWYLPSIGELMDMYGTDTSKITAGWSSTSGAVGDNKKAINDALGELEKYGIAAKLTNGYYWSSSEYGKTDSWVISMESGNRLSGKGGYSSVRAFQKVENLDFSAGRPKISDVMYADKTWGSADDYDGSKTAVGIVTEVGADGSVKIMNLKDLTFSSSNSVGNFNPDDPYGGSVKYTYHTTNAKYNEDVTGIPNYDSNALLNAVKPGGTINVTFAPSSSGGEIGGETGGPSGNKVDVTYAAQYNEILNQYNSLINDASYKGVNLLTGDSLNVKFNETGSAGLNVRGKDISSAALSFNTADWQTQADIARSLSEISAALQSIRSFSAELGNNYSIITGRQDFTENLINILTEGADKLTLADMNEESANMLALQTRQQLAVNSLSLASQASQAVLKLF